MDVFGRVFAGWRYRRWEHIPFFGPKKSKEKPYTFSKYDYYAYKFQSIVIWEHPTQTVSCLLFIQLLFWMIVNLCWKFYGIVFTLLLIFCAHDVWTEKIWPEIRLPQPNDAPFHETVPSNARILTTTEIEEYFNNLILHAKMTLIRFQNLRNSHPTLFCSLLSVCFSLLTIVGCAISGIWLLYMIVMTIFLSPGIYIHLLPQSLKASLQQYFSEFVSISSLVVGLYSEEDDEYVPKFSKENLDEAYASLFHLNDASNGFSSADKDDLLVPSLGTLPSFDDTSLDELDRLTSMGDEAMKMSLEFSEDSSISSEMLSEMVTTKFQGVRFDDEDGARTSDGDVDIDLSSEEENEKAFLPDPQYRRKASESSAAAAVAASSVLSAFVSNLTFPDWNQFGKNWFPNHRTKPSSSSTTISSNQSKNNDNTDDEYEFIDESELNN